VSLRTVDSSSFNISENNVDITCLNKNERGKHGVDKIINLLQDSNYSLRTTGNCVNKVKIINFFNFKAQHQKRHLTHKKTKNN